MIVAMVDITDGPSSKIMYHKRDVEFLPAIGDLISLNNPDVMWKVVDRAFNFYPEGDTNVVLNVTKFTD